MRSLKRKERTEKDSEKRPSRKAPTSRRNRGQKPERGGRTKLSPIDARLQGLQEVWQSTEARESGGFETIEDGEYECLLVEACVAESRRQQTLQMVFHLEIQGDPEYEGKVIKKFCGLDGEEKISWAKGDLLRLGVEWPEDPMDLPETMVALKEAQPLVCVAAVTNAKGYQNFYFQYVIDDDGGNENSDNDDAPEEEEKPSKKGRRTSTSQEKEKAPPKSRSARRDRKEPAVEDPEYPDFDTMTYREIAAWARKSDVDLKGTKGKGTPFLIKTIEQHFGVNYDAGENEQNDGDSDDDSDDSDSNEKIIDNLDNMDSPALEELCEDLKLDEDAAKIAEDHGGQDTDEYRDELRDLIEKALSED